jgi:hypothetical protein
MRAELQLRHDLFHDVARIEHHVFLDNLVILPLGNSGSLRAHLLDGNPCFIGKWDAGKTEAESKRLVRLIQTAEEYRIKTTPGNNARPSRHASAAIALIRADFAGHPRFLMIKSRSWNPEGAWTPVMGVAEPSDASLFETVKREIQEEMKLRPGDTFEPRELCKVKDQRSAPIPRIAIIRGERFGPFAPRAACPLFSASVT